MSILISSYQDTKATKDILHNCFLDYIIFCIVDGIPLEVYGEASDCESGGVWDEPTALAWLNGQYSRLSEQAESAVQQFFGPTKTNGIQIAEDFITESPPMPTDATEAKTWLKAEIIKDRKSHVLMTFCQCMMAFDQAEFKNAYNQAITDLENIENLTDLQIQNNLGDIIRSIATIKRKTLKALKKMTLNDDVTAATMKKKKGKKEK